MIVLDTHVLVWLASAPEKLSAAAGEAIAADDDRAICTISAQEIAYLAMRGRLVFDRPVGRWLRDALAAHAIEPLPPSVAVAVRAGSLDLADFHGDPADRLIYATAVEHGGRLVSADERMRALDGARVIW